MTLPLPDDVKVASQRLVGIVNRTPVMTSRTLDRLVNAKVFFKCENFQRVGAFKFRGAYNAISKLDASQKSAGVITHSSGNHAQGLALAARLQNVDSVVVMPEDAPELKRSATEAYGAKVIGCEARDREEVTAKQISENNYTLIHPYDNSDIISGQGTAALELFEDVEGLDVLLVPVGGGGLISGCSLASRLLAPKCRVIGVEPELGDDANRSWRQGKIVSLNHVPETMADGLRTRYIGERNLALMRIYVSDMATVSEDEILESLSFLWNRMKLVVEPSAAVPLAPLLAGQVASEGRRIGVILSGGNVDLEAFHRTHRSLDVKQPQRSIHSTRIAEKARPRVLITEPFHSDGRAILGRDFYLEEIHQLEGDRLRTKLANSQILLVGDQTKVNGLDIEYAHNLRIIASTGNRLDNIDVSAARAHGIEILYATGANALAAAEHTLSLILQLSYGDYRSGASRGLAGKTLGIIGFGQIGREVARRAMAFDMRVIINQPRLTPELALEHAANVDLPKLLAEADFVTLHVPFKPGSSALLSADEFGLMKESAYLINISHTGLVDEDALIDALDARKISGGALATFEPQVKDSQIHPGPEVRHHPLIIEAQHITEFRELDEREAAVDLAHQIVGSFHKVSPSESLSLEIIPVDKIKPHEQIDEKRVARLMDRLESDGRLVNPPVVASWENKYIVLDGATRFTALKRLGYRYLIVQTVSLERGDFELHTWYHVISGSLPSPALYSKLEAEAKIKLKPLSDDEASTAFQRAGSVCYFIDRDNKITLISVDSESTTAGALEQVVEIYTEWGSVERTLLTDVDRLKAQFPKMIAVVIFPQFSPETVFMRATKGELLPAGLTRFVIPGRILRLNADLKRLKAPEDVSAKRAWLNGIVEEKLAKSRHRYYSEPVVLLDE